MSWSPVSSIGQALQDQNLLDLINKRDEQRLIECGRRYVSLTNEKQLFDELRLNKASKYDESLWSVASTCSDQPLGLDFGDLVSNITSNLNRLRLTEAVPLQWHCELSKSFEDIAFIILRPTIPEYSTTYDLVNSSCTLVLTSTESQLGVYFGNTILAQFFRAIHEPIAYFAHVHNLLVKTNTQTGSPMQWTLSIGSVTIGLQPALQVGSGALLILRSSQSQDGDNVIKRFEAFAAARIASLPNKGHWMFCAMKYITNVIHHIDTPPGLFESIAMEEFERRGWVGELDESAIGFLDVWRQCWNRVLSWRSISSLGFGLLGDNLFDFFSERDKQLLLECAGRYVAITERELIVEFRRETTSNSPAARTAPTRTDVSRAKLSFSLTKWLSTLGLSHLTAQFHSNGFEEHDLDVIVSLTDADLQTMDVPQNLRNTILASICQLTAE